MYVGEIDVSCLGVCIIESKFKAASVGMGLWASRATLLSAVAIGGEVFGVAALVERFLGLCIWISIPDCSKC